MNWCHGAIISCNLHSWSRRWRIDSSHSPWWWMPNTQSWSSHHHIYIRCKDLISSKHYPSNVNSNIWVFWYFSIYFVNFFMNKQMWIPNSTFILFYIHFRIWKGFVLFLIFLFKRALYITQVSKHGQHSWPLNKESITTICW